MLYAHFDRGTGQYQELLAHLQEVARRMTLDCGRVQGAEMSEEEWEDLLYKTGLFHDIGKASKAFQEYLQSGKGGMEKNHALISAVFFFKACRPPSNYAYLAFISIVRHHTAMDVVVPTVGQEYKQLPRQYADCFQQLREHELSVPGMAESPYQSQEMEEYLKILKRMVNPRRRCAKNFFLLQYLFSKLIWADKLDSAGIAPAPQTKIREVSAVDEYLAMKYKGGPLDLSDTRSKIANSVLQRLHQMSDADIQEKRIFTLTAPTGTGKTLTSIRAALLLQRRIHLLEGYVPRIITAIPFLNILEQAQAEYEGIFGSAVLVQHSASIVEAKEDFALKDTLLMTNAWENDVIVTTFVQFFESIFTAQNSRVMKVHKLAGSIVILDEIQSLPATYYPLIGACLKHLSDFYGMRFILMTATQPEIVAYGNLLLPPDQRMEAVELLEEYAQYFQNLRRTKIVPVMDKVQDDASLVDWVLQTKGEGQSALVVVNTIAQSIAVYQMLKKAYAGQCDVFYLSTNRYSLERKKTIQQVAAQLEDHRPCVLVSTQTVEAGVDLDFDVGYRDLAQLESIIQVAGRINRCGKKGEASCLYVFDTKSSRRVYALHRLHKTKALLDRVIPEAEYGNLVHQYYQTLLVEEDSYDRTIYEALLKLDYTTIDTFQMIQEQGKDHVIIVADETIEAVLEEYCRLLRGPNLSFDEKARLRQLMGIIGQYTVDARVNGMKSLQPPSFFGVYGIELPYYVVPRAQLWQYYDETGLIRDKEDASIF